MNISMKEAIELNGSLNRVQNKGIAPKTTVTLFGLKDELEDAITAHKDAFKNKLEEYGVELADGVYNWAEKENATEISASIQGLFDAIIEVENPAKLNDQEIATITNGMTVEEAFFLRRFLKK